MPKYLIVSLIGILLASGASAREVETLDAMGFAGKTPETMDPSKIYFTYTTEPGTFSSWLAQSPVEVEHLALWRGYTEPMVPLRTQERAVHKPLVVFISRAKAILNKPASSINYASFLTLEFIQSLNTDFVHQPVSANQILPNIAGKGPVRTFNWCNTPQDDEIVSFTRAMREWDLGYLNPPADSREPWCSNSERSVCIESCFIFDGSEDSPTRGWRQGTTFANNTVVASDDQKDLGVATQSEIRYFLSEDELGMDTPVSALTGVNTKVAGVLRQNIFYVNQALQFGTVTAFFQEFPGDPSRTVVTSYFVFTVGESTWNGYRGMLRSVLMGRGGNLNTATGITAGLPKFTEMMANSITTILER